MHHLLLFSTLRFFLIISIVACGSSVISQTYWGKDNYGVNDDRLVKCHLAPGSEICLFEEGNCTFEDVGLIGQPAFQLGTTMTPEGDLYSLTDACIFIYDTITGDADCFFCLPWLMILLYL